MHKLKSANKDKDEQGYTTVVPFQIAYVVSIHKAQGLEYDSVKIVITDKVEELVTHSIFYTTITHARNKLKIYCTPEVDEKVLMSRLVSTRLFQAPKKGFQQRLHIPFNDTP